MKTLLRFFRTTPAWRPVRYGLMLLCFLGAFALVAPTCLGQAALVKDITLGPDGTNIIAMVNANGTLFLQVDVGRFEYELWKSDGTVAGTKRVKDINPTGFDNVSRLTNLNGALYFRANDGIHGDELWKSDGTEAGTVLVKDLLPGAGDSRPENLTALNGTLYFQANDNSQSNLWKSNGTSAGTVKLKATQSNREFTLVNNTVFFVAYDQAHGDELWKTDGTPGGTVLVKDLKPGPSTSYPVKLSTSNGTLFFVAEDGVTGVALWKSNGTAAGTVLVKAFNPQGTATSFYHFTSFKNQLFFSADYPRRDQELWKSNGTEAGTVRVKDIYPGPDGRSDPNELTVFGGRLFFGAESAEYDRELWVSDGDEASTRQFKDIYPGDEEGGYPGNLTVAGGTLYFTAQDDITGRELWKTDGTPEGTVRVTDINPGEGWSLPDKLTVVNNTLFFTAYTDTYGYELWKLELAPLVVGTPVCAGQAVTLTTELPVEGLTAFLSDASGAFPNGGTPLGAVATGTNQVLIPAATPSGTGYRIRLVGTDPAYESDPSSPFTVTGLAANFNSTPTVSQTPACAGGSIRVSFTVRSGGACDFPTGNTFSAQLSDASGSFASPVDLGTVTPGVNTVALPQTIPTGSGYRVRIAASADAEVLLTAASAPFTINQPTFSGTPSVSGDNKCAGQTVRLSFSVNNCAFFSGNMFTLELSDASGANFTPIPGAVSPGVLNNVLIPANTPAGTGYKLRVVSSNPALTSAPSGNFKVKACGNSREVAPEDLGLRVVVSPNPAPEGRLRIAVSGAEGQALRVELFGATGQVLREQNLPKAGEEDVLDWDITQQPAGLYLLRVTDGRESKTLKVLH